MPTLPRSPTPPDVTAKNAAAAAPSLGDFLLDAQRRDEPSSEFALAAPDMRAAANIAEPPSRAAAAARLDPNAKALDPVVSGFRHREIEEAPTDVIPQAH